YPLSQCPLPRAPTHVPSCIENFLDTCSSRSFVEWGLYSHGIHGLIADHDLDRLTDRCPVRRQIAQSDVFAECWRGRSARHPARRRTFDVHFITIARNTACFHFKAH